MKLTGRGSRGSAAGDLSLPPDGSRGRLGAVGHLALTGAAAVAGVAGLLVLGEVHVSRTARGRVFDVDTIPARPIAMVLGAQAYADRPCSFLAARLDLAIELYERGKIRAVLVSGDNTAGSNHETTVMQDYLVERGIPAEKVVQDPAGFDTYDSCVRARDVFGVSEMIILSQLYHLERAIAICEDIRVDAIGVGDVSTRDRFPYQYSVGQRREWGANVKMAWDLLIKRRPRQDPFDDTLLRAAAL